MTETDSVAGKVISTGQMAYHKLTDAPSRLTDEEKWNENSSEICTNGLKKRKRVNSKKSS